MAEWKRPEGIEKEALSNWKAATAANKDQLDREIEDLRWQVAENQWDADARAARGADLINGISVAARPCISIPKIKQPMSIVDAQFRTAHLGINIHPVSEDADTEVAEVLQDLYRAVERDSNAGQARWWAFDRAKQAGRGWYRFNTVYDESTGDPFDQKLVIERILYQSSVVMDPAATKADCSDARWAFLAAWVPIDTFKRRWPEANLSKVQEDSEGSPLEIEAAIEQTPDWVQNDEPGKPVRVTEYWLKHFETVEIVSRDGKQKRKGEKVRLMWYVLAPGGPHGLEIIEEQEWNGEDIPLIPAIGTELQPFNEERRYEGMVRPARDGQKLYNFSASTMVEAASSLPKSPWMGDIEQFAPYLQVWNQANVRLFPFLPYKSISVDGNAVPPPQRVQVDGSTLAPIMMMMQQADDFIQSATATPDPVLGKSNTKNQSGKAIEALQGQSEASNSSYIQNFADVTMQYEAKVGIGMIRRIYDRSGRVTQVLNAEGDVRPVMLNAPFVEGKNGRPIPAAKGLPGQTTTQQPQQPKTYNLGTGFYGVSVTVGKSWNTRKEQGAEVLGSIMEKDPELGVVLSPLFLKFMDGPGMAEAADLAREYRDLKYPGIGKSKDGVETPEQLQAKLKAAEMQIQQMQQMGQQMQQELQNQQAKAQAEIEKVQIKAQSDAQVAMLKAQTDAQGANAEAALKIELERMQAETEERIELIRQEAENARLASEQAFEAKMLMMEQRFAAIEAEKGRQQAQEMAEEPTEVESGDK